MKGLYLLPWKKHDNPNGWLEITKSCTLACPGCYRSGKRGKSKGIPEIKREVDFLIKERNVQAISLAGGEPLLHPKIQDIVRYIRSEGIYPKIFTNGILLSEKKLRELKSAGAEQIVIHIGNYQGRGEDSNRARRKFIELFRKVKGVKLSFSITVSEGSLGELEDALALFKENPDAINSIVFTVYKNINPGKKMQHRGLSPDAVSEEIKRLYGIDYAGWLKKEKSDDFAWLFAFPVFCGGKMMGCLDSRAFSMMSRFHRVREGKYAFVFENDALDWKSLLFLAFSRSARKILANYFRLKKKKKIFYNAIIVVNPPDQIEDGWNLCQGCPDAMVYEEQLVPSCLIERIENGEKITIQ